MANKTKTKVTEVEQNTEEIADQTPVVESVEEQNTEEPAVTAKGKIVNCEYLNIRKVPRKTDNLDDIIGILPKGTSLIININKGTKGYYNILVPATGKTAYASKDYIEIVE